MILMQSHREEFFFLKIKGYFRFKPSLHPDEKKSLEIWKLFFEFFRRKKVSHFRLSKKKCSLDDYFF